MKPPVATTIEDRFKRASLELVHAYGGKLTRGSDRAR
jgi:hypothetical protein